ncbi:hypothetical protein [Miniphocaeibacter massiliensis]|uniref:hypothetical protein n=1 Tax=Miniphocaeibacter massiliensis TaxID=2041841 RepID=UPI00101ADAE7|nr:hypothetical protein [Miniphocaeibacter massiliensis]
MKKRLLFLIFMMVFVLSFCNKDAKKQGTSNSTESRTESLESYKREYTAAKNDELYAKFLELKIDEMSKEDVDKILGVKPEEYGYDEDTVYFTYEWNIDVGFKYDKLFEKNKLYNQIQGEDIFSKKFDDLKEGMSKDEVDEILGREGEGRNYKWSITVCFDANGKLFYKSQDGFHQYPKNDISKEKFDKVEIGMTKEEVEGILGEGVLVIQDSYRDSELKDSSHHISSGYDYYSNDGSKTEDKLYYGHVIYGDGKVIDVSNFME